MAHPNGVWRICCEFWRSRSDLFFNRTLATATFLALLGATPAAAFTGEELVSLCRGEDIFEDVSAEDSKLICKSYIRGVVDHSEVHGSYKPLDKMFCLPPNVTFERLRLDFVQWAGAQDLSDKSAGKTLIVSLVQAYPCSAN